MPALGIEARTALRNLRELVHHPGWVRAWVGGGRAALYARMVSDSLRVVAAAPRPSRLEQIPTMRPASPLGKMGATQEYLYYVTRWLRPEVVVETGVHRGLSSAFILAALRDGGAGHLYSIDLPEVEYTVPGRGRLRSSLPASGRTGFAVPATLRDRWTLILGDSKVELPTLLAGLPPIDMFVHDSEHSEAFMTWEFSTAAPHIHAGGLLVSDDVGWNEAFSRFCQSHRVDQSFVLDARLGVAHLRAEGSPPGGAHRI